MRTTYISLLIIAAVQSSHSFAVARPSDNRTGNERTQVSPSRMILAQTIGPKGASSPPTPQAASPAAPVKPQEAPPSSRPEARTETRGGGRAPVNDAYSPPASKAAGNPATNANSNLPPAPRPAPANEAGNTYGGPSAQPWSQLAKPVAAAPVSTGSTEPRDPSLSRLPGSANRWDSSGPSGPPARGPAP